MSIPNSPHSQIMNMWEKHLSKKSKKEQRKILISDENMKDSAAEFYAMIPLTLQQHMSLDGMMNNAVQQRQKYMKKPKNQKKTFGRILKKNSSDFSDIDLSEFDL